MSGDPRMHVGMLIHRPATEVCEAFANPDVITKVWYTRSSGRMTPGAHLTWDWEMYGLTTKVTVHEVEPGSRIVFEWGDRPTTVELRFTPHGADFTHVEVTETGITGTEEEVRDRVAGSTGGFAFVLSAVKALLEHDIVLTVVADAHPADRVR